LTSTFVERVKRADDADHRAEKAHEGCVRADRTEQREPALKRQPEHLCFAGQSLFHGCRAAREGAEASFEHPCLGGGRSCDDVACWHDIPAAQRTATSRRKLATSPHGLDRRAHPLHLRGFGTRRQRIRDPRRE
jgi:hypothetical protein